MNGIISVIGYVVLLSLNRRHYTEGLWCRKTGFHLSIYCYYCSQTHLEDEAGSTTCFFHKKGLKNHLYWWWCCIIVSKTAYDFKNTKFFWSSKSQTEMISIKKLSSSLLLSILYLWIIKECFSDHNNNNSKKARVLISTIQIYFSSLYALI